MNEGRFQQIDTPRNVYDNPANEFVAKFIGRVNVFSTSVRADSIHASGESRFNVMVRPEDIAIQPWDNGVSPEQGSIVGTIVSHAFLGRTVRLEVQLRNQKMITVALPKQETLEKQLRPGRSVIPALGDCQVFPSMRQV